jgi:hypothetical protein
MDPGRKRNDPIRRSRNVDIIRQVLGTKGAAQDRQGKERREENL